MKFKLNKNTKKMEIEFTSTKKSKKRILRNRFIEAIVIDRMSRGYYYN